MAMIHRKRQRSREEVERDEEASNHGEEDHDHTLHSKPQRGFSKRVLMLLACVGAAGFFTFYTTWTKLRVMQVATLTPVAVCSYLAFLRKGPTVKRILPLTLVLTVLSSQLPVFVAAALAASSICAFSIATIPQKQQTGGSRAATASPKTLPVILSVGVLVAVLLTENFMIWVVSATFTPGQRPDTAPPALQDNGHLLIKNYLLHGLTKSQVVQGLRRLWNVQWSLVACMGTSFVVTEVLDGAQKGRTLFGLGARAVWTLAAARAIRTFSFSCTVLPSPVHNCYRQRYPFPPPAEWSEWLWVGILPASHGGCNDLILSGHATVTSTLACIATSVSGDFVFSAALWSLVALDYTVEIYEGFHYSVDMWLGMVVVVLMWRNLRGWEEKVFGKWQQDDERQSASSSSSATIAAGIFQPTTWRERIMFGIPAVIAYLQLVLLPKWTSNFLIVAYVLFSVGAYIKARNHRAQEAASSMHYIQHVVLCLLFMALGIYL